MPDKGDLMLVTIGTATTQDRFHRRFASFCRRSECDFIVALDWGGAGKDHSRGHGVGGEHFHALVRASNRLRFAEELHKWADREGVDPGPRRITTLSGWDDFAERGNVGELRANLTRVIAYITKPPADGRARDLEQHAQAGGVFAKAWTPFVRNATGGVLCTVTRFCPSCCEPAPKSATARWVFCGVSCRVRIHRDPSKRVPRKWVVKPSAPHQRLPSR